MATRCDNRKIALVGTGMVGMSFAYCLLNQAACDELVLIDLDKKRAEGEAMDLNHGLAFAPGNMKIYAGEYSDCGDADIVVMALGNRPDKAYEDKLAAAFDKVIVVGDATKAGTMADATKAAYEKCFYI